MRFCSWPIALCRIAKNHSRGITAYSYRADIQKPELWRKKKLLEGTDRPSTPLDSRPAPTARKCSTARMRKLLDAECCIVSLSRMYPPSQTPP
jgi:hypothetical protein